MMVFYKKGKVKKERKMKKIIIAVSLAISVLIVSQAMAFNPGRMGGCWNTNLKLTTAQSAQMNTLRQKFQRETLELRKKMLGERLEYRTLLSQPNADESKLRKSYESFLSLQKAFQEKRFDHRLAMRKILTPEQLAMLPAGRCGNRRGHNGMGHGFRHGHGMMGGQGMMNGQGMRSGTFHRPCDN